ncbi:MAG: gamma-glutamyltransferase [Gammaproteobacteria bacterium]|nr:gamma-glutamyltransferase [Gammaproteobacteria bacterium]
MHNRHWQALAASHFEVEKQPATGVRGMVVTNHPLGSAAGAQMLAGGGNAIDAAIAALFALTVVEPMMVGIFGAGMSTIRLANGEHHFINNYATAPATATPDMYRPIADTWPDYQVVEGRENEVGALAIGVPGTLKGWCEALNAYGSLSLDDVLQPAIRYARRGYRATQYLHELISKEAADIALFEDTARLYLPGGRPLAPGARVVQSDYASTLETLAQEGPELLYGGALGQAAADHIQATGGLITTSDLAAFSTVHTQPVRGTYRGHDIIGPAPPSAGGVHIVQMLNVIEAFDVRGMGFGTTQGIHLLAETLKIGFEDRRIHTGDPAFVEVPVAMLTSKEYAEEKRHLIDMQSAREVDTGYSNTARSNTARSNMAPSNAAPSNMAHGAETPHTTTLTTADADGNIVAATHTLHSAFGSKVMVPGTGMLLNNTMNIFDPHPGLANSVAPGKRMTSSMSPVIVERDGKPVFALGSVGGTRIFPSVFQAIVNIIDHGMSPQEAVEAPRLWTLGEEVELEAGMHDDVLAALKSRGHRLAPLNIIGGGMGMIHFGGQCMTGASCWRADGTPIGIGGGMARPGIRFAV